MFKIVRRGIVAHLGRLALTLISVVLGVAFVSGSFVLADSLRAIFDQVSAQAFAGVDAQVRAEEPEIQSSQTTLLRFDDSITDDVSALPEVQYAEGGLFAFEQAYALLEDGTVSRPLGPPVFTGSWGGPSPVSSFTLVEGEAPTGQQVAFDEGQFDAAGFEVGDMVTMVLPSGEPEEFELSGVVSFGDGGAAGAYFNIFDLPTSQRVLEAEGQIDSIVVSATEGVSTDELLAAIDDVLPSGTEVVSGQTVIGEQEEEFDSFITIFGNVLLGFAVVVLFVSIFIIYNTFAILVGQRTRQLGLLRTVGASAGQIRAMVLIEAVIIGLIASVVGLFGGIGVAWLLKQLFSTGGGAFPDGPLQIQPRTVVVVFIVGLVVTVASALIPAIRASRVSPLEAVRDEARRPRSLTFRIVSGAAVLVPGLVLLGVGMFASIDGTAARLSAIGVGAALTFIGVSMVSALFAGRTADVLGVPVEGLKGITGRLARDNASRNPQRTAATATALMIGLALITGIAVLRSSILATFDELLEDAIAADLFIFEENQGLPFSANLVDQLEGLDGVEQVAGFSEVEARLGDEVETLAAFDVATGTDVVNYGIVDGTPLIGESGLAVYEETAEDNGWELGTSVPIEFEDGFTTELTIEAIYDDRSVVTRSFVIDRELSRQHVQIDEVGFVGLTFSEGADIEATRAAVEDVTTAFPQLSVQDNTEFQENTRAQIDQLQIVILGLLGLCLVVAFFGIVNTMALSVLERIREIGLLRAVGTTRRQLRTAIRWEAVIVAIFGSLLGVAMGLLLGWAAVVAIPDEFISRVGIPWLSLVIYLVVGAVLGIIAAYFPARRAAKLNVLDAIAHE